MSKYYLVKAILDRFVSFVALLFLLPLFLLLIVLVHVDLGYPVFFVQRRIGFRNSVFTIYKFRTMKAALEGDSSDNLDRLRLSRFGRILRSTSLDELPSLVNILFGQMSFVGPRPLLVEYLPLYSSCQIKRHDVLPGLTGYAQVNGRNLLSWDRKFELDVYYIMNYNFLMDFSILIRTLIVVICTVGITSRGEATSTPFTGS